MDEMIKQILQAGITLVISVRKKTSKKFEERVESQFWFYLGKQI